MTVFTVAARVGVVADGEDVYVASLPDGPILTLTGTAALVWRAALGGPVDGIVARVAEASGLDAEAIAGDVDEFVRTLLARGLLVEADAEGY